MSFDYTVSKLNSLKKSQQDSKTAREEEERKEAVAKLRTKQRAEVGVKVASHCSVLHTVSNQKLDTVERPGNEATVYAYIYKCFIEELCSDL